ncbi:SRPBCC family protein [Kineococcus sp. SYSU DK001]|uniref:SRPBCC family protein n=1 Tax=Kineococcus sp. SYSU DK001 TaxID=3383122 RepID=UPI003D7D3A47
MVSDNAVRQGSEDAKATGTTRAAWIGGALNKFSIGTSGFPDDLDAPVEGTVDLDVPVEQFWRLFADVRGWPSWNSCMSVARVHPGDVLSPGSTLLWAFRPIRRRYLYRLPSLARSVVVVPCQEVTWEVTVLPGFHARHTYSFEALDGGRCRFGSWERASGPTYRLLRSFWRAHFRFVLEASLAGAVTAAARGEGAARLVRYGDATTGTPLVVVPGLDGSVGTVAPLVQALAQTRPVHLVDYRTERNTSLEGLAREIADLVTRARLGKVDVLATSLGSIAAAQAISQHGMSARRVVLIGTFTRLPAGRLRLTNRIIASTPRWGYRRLAPLLMSYVCGPVGDGADHPFFERIRRSDPVQVVKRTQWEVGRDFAPDLAALIPPTLVLMGARDRFVSDPQREVATIRRCLTSEESQVRLLPGAGHVLLPRAAVAAAVSAAEDFLQED